MWNAATVMHLNKHCLPVARKLAVRHTSFVCLTASFLATCGFVKLFHKIP